jgi:D-proline reductase (dithiol) PrdB
MNNTPTAGETFEDFKKSFFYGSRSDMNFKFVANLTDEQAGKFFQGLLWKIADAYDDGNTDRVFAHILEWQASGYSDEKNFDYSDGPFAEPSKPVKEATVVLLTSSGHFAAGDDPEPFGLKNMTQQAAEKRIFDFLKAEPVLSQIPRNIPPAKLEVRHGGYDIRGSGAEANRSFPLDMLAALEEEGKIGCLAPYAYSFVGACAQTRLLKRTGPEWTAKLLAGGVEAAVLVPV